MTTRAAYLTETRQDIRWGRIVAAAVMSEAGVMAAMFIAMGVYSTLIAPGLSAEAYSSLGEDVGYYVAPPAAAVTTVLAVLWVGRSLSASFIQHGLLVGLVAVLLTFGFIFGARPEHRLMYVVSFALRFAGGYVGGVIAHKMRR